MKPLSPFIHFNVKGRKVEGEMKHGRRGEGERKKERREIFTKIRAKKTKEETIEAIRRKKS